MRLLGLIPARGGSKGIPRKNTRELCGKPLIQYTIDTAQSANVFDEIMVSTEDEQIATISKKLGASVPFLRPLHLASDSSPTIDTVIHVLTQYHQAGDFFDAVCLLQPTNPLRTADLIRKSVEHFKKSNADSLISVRRIPHELNPHWAFEKDKNGMLKIATGEKEIISRRQELPTAYHRDGTIYITRSNVILQNKSLYGDKISFIEVDQQPHVNIDTMEDWEQAKKIICAG